MFCRKKCQWNVFIWYLKKDSSKKKVEQEVKKFSQRNYSFCLTLTWTTITRKGGTKTHSPWKAPVGGGSFSACTALPHHLSWSYHQSFPVYGSTSLPLLFSLASTACPPPPHKSPCLRCLPRPPRACPPHPPVCVQKNLSQAWLYSLTVSHFFASFPSKSQMYVFLFEEKSSLQIVLINGEKKSIKWVHFKISWFFYVCAQPKLLWCFVYAVLCFCGFS